MRKTIAVLFHESGRDRGPRDYAIGALARFWRRDGHRVVFLYGVEKFVPADLVVVHVDLSVVPQEYLDFAARYPAAVNGAVRDVRKSSFSRNRLAPEDSWDGRVIVKSNLNYAGIPERVAASAGPRGFIGFFRRAVGPGPDPAGTAPEFRAPTDYRIYERAEDLPEEAFGRPDLVVERFLPEMEDGLYCLRLLHFLGDRTACIRIASPSPIVKTDNRVRRDVVDPHPDILEMRRRLRFDYGKFDYVVHGGKAVLLDVNKTPGEGPVRRPEVEARVRHIASGVSSFLP